METSNSTTADLLDIKYINSYTESNTRLVHFMHMSSISYSLNIQKYWEPSLSVETEEQFAKAAFLRKSLDSAMLGSSLLLSLVLITIELKELTTYWVITFLIVLPFFLQQLGHLLTVLFELGHMRYTYGRGK